MPLSAACLMIGFKASRSDGLMMIALAPAEMRLRMSAICSDGPPFRLATITFETRPDASASALIEQIISSRQPLPISVFDTPTMYLPAADAVPPAAAAKAKAATAAMRCFLAITFLPGHARPGRPSGDAIAATFYVKRAEVQAPFFRLDATAASMKARPRAPSTTSGVAARA